jgi:AAA15 family ATPase/GTPase
MAISRVKIKDFLVFRGEFTVDFCSGVNVFIGGNGTGKTTLQKCLYYGADRFSNSKKMPKTLQKYFGITEDYDTVGNTVEEIEKKFGMITMYVNEERFEFSYSYFGQPRSDMITLRPVYIPAKDILEHSKGLLALNNTREIPFDQTYIDILSNAELGITKEISETNNVILSKVKDVIGGEVEYENDTFYIVKSDGQRVPYSLEASGYRKFGLLWKLIRNGLLGKDSVLFWDEPENSINPELMSVLVDILLKLQRSGVQIFIATHNEILASYFDVKCKDGDSVMFYSLYKDGKQIKVDKNEKFGLLEPNYLTAEQVKLYECEIKKGLGNEE